MNISSLRAVGRIRVVDISWEVKTIVSFDLDRIKQSGNFLLS
jgi:hypothetical protein